MNNHILFWTVKARRECKSAQASALGERSILWRRKNYISLWYRKAGIRQAGWPQTTREREYRPFLPYQTVTLPERKMDFSRLSPQLKFIRYTCLKIFDGINISKFSHSRISLPGGAMQTAIEIQLLKECLECYFAWDLSCSGGCNDIHGWCCNSQVREHNGSAN